MQVFPASHLKAVSCGVRKSPLEKPFHTVSLKDLASAQLKAGQAFAVPLEMAFAPTASSTLKLSQRPKTMAHGATPMRIGFPTQAAGHLPWPICA